jgi:hypothetical protein
MNERLPIKTLEAICKKTNCRYVLQVGYRRNSYITTYAFDSQYKAGIYYRAMLIHSGFKKRLVDTVEGVILERYLS